MRFDLNANTISDAVIYLNNRRIQLAHTGAVFTNYVPSTTKDGVWATITYRGETYYSFYLLDKHRGGNAYLYEYNKKCEELNEEIKIFTTTNCNMHEYLDHKNIPHVVVDGLTQSMEYKLIEKIYASEKTKRSGVYLMNHIDEGLYILYTINARTKAKLAYILHPVFQGDEEIVNNITLTNINSLDVKAVMLAMEYRHIANDYLSTRTLTSLDDIRMSPLNSVRNMLIADKIQNSNDFDKYHKFIHDRSDELTLYFKTWMKKLGISEDTYNGYKKELNNLNTIKVVI